MSFINSEHPKPDIFRAFQMVDSSGKGIRDVCRTVHKTDKLVDPETIPVMNWGVDKPENYTADRPRQWGLAINNDKKQISYPRSGSYQATNLNKYQNSADKWYIDEITACESLDGMRYI